MAKQKVWVPPHVKEIDGHLTHIDGYWRFQKVGGLVDVAPKFVPSSTKSSTVSKSKVPEVVSAIKVTETDDPGVASSYVNQVTEFLSKRVRTMQKSSYNVETHSFDYDEAPAVGQPTFGHVSKVNSKTGEQGPNKPTTLEAWSDPELAATVEAVAAAILPVKSNPSLVKSTKMKIGKDRNRLEQMARFSRFLNDLKNNNLSADEIEKEIEFWDKKFSGKTWSNWDWYTNPSAAYSDAKRLAQKKIFTFRTADLPFTIDAVSDEVLTKYLNANVKLPDGLVAGFAQEGSTVESEYLTPVQRKILFRVWLKDPSLTQNEMASAFGVNNYAAPSQTGSSLALAWIAKKAHTQKSYAGILAYGKASQASVAAEPPLSPDIDQAAVDKFMLRANVIKNLNASLKSRYSVKFKDGSMKAIVWDGSEFRSTDENDDFHFSPEEAIEYLTDDNVESFSELPNAEKVETAWQKERTFIYKLLSEYSYQNQKPLNNWMKEHGANYTQKMKIADKRDWITFHLAGLEIAKYAEEDWMTTHTNVGKQWDHKGKDTHPGSPYSPTGKKSWQMFRDLVAVRPWGKSFLAGKPVMAWTDEEVESAYFDLFVDTGEAFSQPEFSDTVMRERLGSFLKWVNASVLEKYGFDVPTPGVVIGEPDGTVIHPNKITPKPNPDDSGVPSLTWELLMSIEQVPQDNDSILKALGPVTSLAKLYVEDKKKFEEVWSQSGRSDLNNAPPSVKIAWLWASNTSYDSGPKSDVPSNLLKAIMLRENEGTYDKPIIPGSLGSVQTEDGNVYAVRPGDQFFTQDDSTVVLVKHVDGTESGPFTKDSTYKNFHAFNPTSVKVEPIDISLDEALESGAAEQTNMDPSDFKAAWDAHEGWSEKVSPAWATTDNEYAWTENEFDDALREAMDKAGVSVFHQTLFLNNVPETVKENLWFLQKVQDESVLHPQLRVAIWKAEHGSYGFSQGKQIFDPKKPYFPLIAKGSLTESDVGNWDYYMKAEFVKDFLGNTTNANDSAGISQALYKMLDPDKKLQAMQLAKQKAKLGALIEDDQYLNFKYMPNGVQQVIGSDAGMHTKYVYKDQFGRDWMAKTFASDPDAQARIEAEHYANVIGRSLGFGSPATFARQMETPDGSRMAFVQHLKPAPGGTMKNQSATDWSDDDLYDIASEHLLDWILANHDSHPANLLRGDNGRIFGVDKGQAWKFFPDDKLAVDYLPAGNPIPVVYDAIYHGIENHTISKEKADKLVKRVLKRAKMLQKRRDKDFRSYVEKAMANRDKFPDGMTREQFVEAIVDRKHNVAYDFEALYKGVYEKAGYKWELPSLDQIDVGTFEGPNEQTVFVGISSDLLDTASKVQVHGVPSFFAGEDLEAGHILFFEEKAKDGTKVLIGDGRLRRDADARIHNWINSHHVVGQVSSPTVPKPVSVDVLPFEEDWAGNIVAGAKTVNKHASDHEYNESTLASLQTSLNQMKDAESLWKNYEKSHPDTSDHKKAAFFEMAKQYSGYAEEILEAKAKGQKTYADHSDWKVYPRYDYIPPTEPGVIHEYQGGDQLELVLKEYDDGSWKLENKNTGEAQELSKVEAKKKVKEFQQAQLLQGGFKLFKRENSRPEGKMDLASGVLTETGGDLTQGMPGAEYDIEVGNDVVIEYRPWNGLGNPPAQQGLLRIRVKNFSGDEDQVQKAIDALSQMGLDLSPADEVSLELLYWRQLYGVIQDRKGHSTGNNKKVIDYVKNHKQSGMSPEEELAMLRNAFEIYYGEEKVQKANWMPQIDHYRVQNPTLRAGTPYWWRPDMTPEEAVDYFPIPTHSYSNNEARIRVPYTGGLMATEERTRMYGQWIDGMSSWEDQNQHGSSQFLFTLPKGGSASVSLAPWVWLRTTNYAYDSDYWGNLGKRKDYAPFDLDQMKLMGSELDIKNSVSLLDNFLAVYVDPAKLQEILEFFRSIGITHIHGIPIEKFFLGDKHLVSQAGKDNLEKYVKEWLKTHSLKDSPVDLPQEVLA